MARTSLVKQASWTRMGTARKSVPRVFQFYVNGSGAGWAYPNCMGTIGTPWPEAPESHSLVKHAVDKIMGREVSRAELGKVDRFSAIRPVRTSLVKQASWTRMGTLARPSTFP